jgi:hypothetical protein
MELIIESSTLADEDVNERMAGAHDGWRVQPVVSEHHITLGSDLTQGSSPPMRFSSPIRKANRRRFKELPVGHHGGRQ